MVGFVITIVLAVAIAAGAGDSSGLWAIPLAGFSVIFIPAIIVSWWPTPARQWTLRAVTVGALVMSLVGSPAYGIELPIVMSAPIGLLAQAAGFIFQGGAAKGR